MYAALPFFLAKCEEITTQCVPFQKCYIAKNLELLVNGSDDREERHQKVKELQDQTCYLSNERGFCCKLEEISQEDLTEKYGKSLDVDCLFTECIIYHCFFTRCIIFHRLLI